MLKKVVRETEIWKLTVPRRNNIFIAFYQHRMDKGITLEADEKRMYVSAIRYDDVVGKRCLKNGKYKNFQPRGDSWNNGHYEMESRQACARLAGCVAAWCIP